MSDKITKPEDFLAHYGVMGMKWGKHSATKTANTDSASSHKSAADEKFKKDLIKAAALTGAYVAVRQGANWAASHPEEISHLMGRAANMAAGTKAIGPGYDIVKLTLGRNGIWK